MTEAHRIKRLEVNCQIGILRVTDPVPIIDKTTHSFYGEVAHYLLVSPGWSPLWFDREELGGEVWAVVDVVALGSNFGGKVRSPKWIFLRWPEHEVAASVMAKWKTGHPHPLWDWQLDMAAVRPEWEYDTVMVNDRDPTAVESISFRRGVLLPPL